MRLEAMNETFTERYTMAHFTLPETDDRYGLGPTEQDLCNVNMFWHSTMLPSGLASESESVPESVFGNVNEPLNRPNDHKSGMLCRI